MTATAQSTARATAAATAARPKHAAPATAAPRRPPLRVVEPGERAARTRKKSSARPRLLVAGGVLLGAALLFGLVAAHVLLTQNQFRLQKVQRAAAAEQARYERLRAQVAEMESPARVVAAAQQRLGMVPPASIKYLTPATAQSTTGLPASGAAVNKTAAAQRGPGDGDGDGDELLQDADQQAMAEWSAVKRRLSRP